MNTTSLKDLLEAAAAKRGGASGRALTKAAQDHGFSVSYTLINGLRKGTYKSMPGDETLRAVAWLAGVPEAEAFTAAGKPAPGPPFAAELPPGVDNLSPRSRKAALAVLTALVHAETGEQAHDQHDQDQQEPRPRTTDAEHESADRVPNGSEARRSGAPMSEGDELASRRAQIDATQSEADAAPVEEILKHAAYRPDPKGGDE